MSKVTSACERPDETQDFSPGQRPAKTVATTVMTTRVQVGILREKAGGTFAIGLSRISAFMGRVDALRDLDRRHHRSARRSDGK